MKRLERIRAGESARMVSHFSQGNGFGKVMGTTQVIEPGEVETPILRENGVMVTDDIP
ncbi:MAG: hypothetical protein Q8L60_02910 [Gammaproteobacteria bacterium]|nr:hypothetical protein [Gammaproteobacteria bacterium]MDP2142455.1 hypothetical protein [Gammaproteobacteria bacterium]MDP2348780.1 hypothetical protein [Gammaproteobacteria bacterium]